MAVQALAGPSLGCAGGTALVCPQRGSRSAGTNSRRYCRQPRFSRGLGRLQPTAAAGEQDRQTSGSESPEALFRKELERRGLAGSSRDPDERPSSSTPSQQTKDKEQRASPPKSADQLEKSRALNSEGIEGLIPRLSELAKLGLTFFLAFGPLILVTAVLFGGLYSIFGDEFIHGGRTFTSIPYVDPQDLLDEPSVDPTIPFR